MSKKASKLSRVAMKSQSNVVGPREINPSTEALNTFLAHMARPGADVAFMQEKVPGENVWLLKAMVGAGTVEEEVFHLSQDLSQADLSGVSVPDALYRSLSSTLKKSKQDYNADLMCAFAQSRTKMTASAAVQVRESEHEPEATLDKQTIQVMALNQWTYEPPERYSNSGRLRKQPFFSYQDINALFRGNHKLPATQLKNIFLGAMVVSEAINAYSRTSKGKQYGFTTRVDLPTYAPHVEKGVYKA